MKEVYLDNSATTKVIPEAVEAVKNTCSEFYGNPSSLHGKGIEAEKIIKNVRRKIAAKVKCQPGEIYFTSGGTEANNWAVREAAARRSRSGRHIITTDIEHTSVLNACEKLKGEGYEITCLPVNSEGVIDLRELEESIRDDTILVSIMHVNNETGAVQPIFKAAELIKSKNKKTLFHVDAVQSFGKINLELNKTGIDLLSLSAHKVYGPKGIGALYIKEGVNINPFLVGGEQENNLRAGTENVPGIAGFGAAVDFISSVEADYKKVEHLKSHLIKEIFESVQGVYINGPEIKGAVPHIVNMSFEGIKKGEVLVHYLEQSGIYISTGSACHSRGGRGSHVLKAMGLKKEKIEGAVRVSFSYHTTEEEVEFTAGEIASAVSELRSLG